MCRKNLKKAVAVMALTGIMTFSAVLSASAATVYGDANADTQVDIRDLVRVKKHLADKTISINVEAVDDDESGEVEISDLTKLKKVLLGAEKYELSVVEGNIEWPASWDE